MRTRAVPLGQSVALALLAFLALPGALPGQTLPLPTLPPVEAPVAGPSDPGAGMPASLGAPGGSLQARPRAWEYELGVGAGYDSNIDFRVPDGPSSWAVSPRGGLARVFWGPKGELRFAGNGSWTGYPEESALNRYDVGASLDGTYRSSLNTTWRANGSYDYGYGDSSTVLLEQGVLLPRVRTETVTGALGLTRRFGLRTSLRLDGRMYSTSFDEEQDAVATALVDGRSLRGTAAIEHRLGTQNTVAVEYSIESALSRTAPGSAEERGPYYLTHFGSLQWTHLFSQRSGILLEGGSSYTPDPEQAGLAQEWSFYGGVTYNRQVKRSDVALYARREVAPAFGLGVSRLETRFGLRATVPMGRVWTLRLDGSLVLPEDPENAALTYSTPNEASASLGRRIGRLFEVSAEGRYRRRGATGTIPAIEGFQAGLVLSLLNPTQGSSTSAGIR